MLFNYNGIVYDAHLKILFDLKFRSGKNWFCFFPDRCENLSSTNKLQILAKSSNIIFPLIITLSSYLFLKLWAYSGWVFRGCPSIGKEGKKAPNWKSVIYISHLWSLAQLPLQQRRSKEYRKHVRHTLSSAYTSTFHQKLAIFVI